MQKIIKKPQYFFLLLAIITLIVGLLNKRNALEIAVYGTLIDLKIWSISLFSTLFFVLIAVNYASLSITNKPARKGLTILHIVLQVIAMIPLFYFIFQSDVSRSYDEISRMNIILILAFFIFMLATIIHLINFMMSLLSKKD